MFLAFVKHFALVIDKVIAELSDLLGVVLKLISSATCKVSVKLIGLFFFILFTELFIVVLFFLTAENVKLDLKLGH